MPLIVYADAVDTSPRQILPLMPHYADDVTLD